MKSFRSFGSKLPKGSFGKESTLGANFSFPRHKELFNEGYYQGDDPTDDGSDMFKSPFSKQMEQQDTLYNKDSVEYGEKGTQSGLNVEGGILQNYRKVAGQTSRDMMEGDFWRANQDVSRQAAKYFNIVTSNEKDMMNNTKNYTMRHRLNRELDFTDDFRTKYMTKEYGNYDKYSKNSVKNEFDNGETEIDSDKFYENYMQLLKRLPTKEADRMKDKKRDDIKNLLTNQEYGHQEFGNKYFDWKVEEEKTKAAENRIDEEVEFMEDPENYEKGYYGRLSPFAKEQLYREYHKGMSVKDLSLKYGILQQRVKAVIFQKHLYWEEVYPKLGESHMRLALEREAMYAAQFPFIEYGLDLHVMAELEKGVKVSKLSTTEYDASPPPNEKEHVNRYIMKMRSRKSDRIPLELQGKGAGGYLL